MDPFTAIAMLAAQLMLSGLVLAVIALRLPQRPEIMDWAGGGLCLGLAFAGRLLTPSHAAASVLGLGADLLMVFGVMLLIRGMARMRGTHWALARVLPLLLVVALVHIGVSLWLPTVARYVGLNALLGVLYLLAGRAAWRCVDEHRSRPGQRLPLRVFSAVTATLGAASLARAGWLALHGVAVLYSGAAAAAYFALASLASVLIALLLLWSIFEQLNGELAELATHDPLTRVLNRHGLSLALGRHFAARPAPPLTLMMVDVDEFKRINDEHGHAEGDVMLRAIAQALTDCCRGSDFVARFGGEEFLVGCCTDRHDVADQLAERIRSRIGAITLIDARGAPLACTVSIGVAAPIVGAAHWEAAAQQADQALYVAKANGRNRCVHHVPVDLQDRAAAAPRDLDGVRSAHA